MDLTYEQRQLLIDQGWQEHNPPKPGLWSKMYGDRIHYVDCRGYGASVYSFDSEGQSSPSGKGNRIVSMIRAITAGQKGLGDF